MQTKPLRYSLRGLMMAFFTLVVLLVSLTAIGLQYYFSQQLVKERAISDYQKIILDTENFLNDLDRYANHITSVLASYPLSLDTKSDVAATNNLFAQFIALNPTVYGVYLGLADGEFYELVNLSASSLAQQVLGSEPNDRWVSMRVSGKGGLRHREYRYFDENFALRHTLTKPDNYDPRIRPWFIEADANQVHQTEPYQFHLLQTSGITYSKRLQGSAAVLGVDVVMSSLSHSFQQSLSNSKYQVHLFQASGELIASNTLVNPETLVHSDPLKKALQASLSMFDEWQAEPKVLGELFVTEVSDKSYFNYINEIGTNGELPYYLTVSVPEDLFMAGLSAKLWRSLLLSALVLSFIIPLSWLLSIPIVKSIKLLDLESLKISQRRYSEIGVVKSNIIEIAHLSESMLNMARSIEKNEIHQNVLMDSVVELIARAIDDKSHYTAGHCSRVPVLAKLLVEKASESQDDAFQAFEFRTKDEWREFHLAAWLHDCGKIITPEHIVDKGTKLECIYNRIHEIRTRFEVLWRDAQIDYLTALAQFPEQKARLAEELTQTQGRLKDDFAFLAESNQGSERQEPGVAERLLALSKIEWRQHFDDRLGLSPVEEMRLQDEAPTLPKTVTLLADLPQHIIPRSEEYKLDDAFGINMIVPEALYNLGELYNLSVPAGTLTKEDRFKINEHMIGTIKILESLPFPAELSKVPRYASTHHETLKGTGYPRGLSAEDLSIPERIIALADVFEALTAADRPYKKAKPLSESLRILRKMVLRQSLDRDVYNLFLTSGVYLEYANCFLQPEQIDQIDVVALLLDASTDADYPAESQVTIDTKTMTQSLA